MLKERKLCPERTCTVCGRYLLVNYLSFVVLHLVGEVYDLWTRTFSTSSFSVVDETQRQVDHPVQKLEFYGSSCDSFFRATSEKEFDMHLMVRTQVCHVSSRWQLNCLFLAFRRKGVLMDVLLPGLAQPLFKDVISWLNNDGVYPYVGALEFFPTLVRMLGILKDVGSPIYSSGTVVTFLLCHYCNLRMGLRGDGWKLVPVVDAKSAWHALSTFELRLKAVVHDDTRMEEMTINVCGALALAIRKLHDYQLFSEEYNISDIGEDHDDIPIYRRSAEMKGGVCSYCEYVDCPYCEPGRTDSLAEHLKIMMCCRRGTLVAS